MTMVTGSRTHSPLGRMLSLIQVPHSSLRFLILDCPTESTLPYYLEEFKRCNVTTVVRCCQQTYSAAVLAEHDIQVHDLPFKDGGVPPPSVVREWLSLLEDQDPTVESTIAVHCVAGLGRAPALVAIGLIELGMQPLDAIDYVRQKRKGAFNKPQITYLDSYKRTLNKTKTTSTFKSSLGKMFKFGTSTKKQQVAIH
ncbi:protein-tyrosine phosphatase-like protein [Spinellus fusiger]|nr:protein-tyrosine phosphatase-like protein [Spinellus fusiger]